jgi:hypothetical protein
MKRKKQMSERVDNLDAFFKELDALCFENSLELVSISLLPPPLCKLTLHVVTLDGEHLQIMLEFAYKQELFLKNTGSFYSILLAVLAKDLKNLESFERLPPK